MQAYRSERTTVGAELRWVHFLLRSTLFCAVILSGSAAIMWVAANWQHWSYSSRITLIVLAFTIPVLLAMRCGQHNPKDWAKPLSVSSTLLVLAALMVGALLALLGQLYHSGADSWRLFAWWVLLLIPWAVGLQSLPIILLSWFLTNVSISLLIVTSFYYFGHFALSVGLALSNGLMYLIFSLWSFSAPRIGAVMRPLSFSIGVFFWALGFVEYAHQKHAELFFSAPWLLGMLSLLLLGGFFQYRRHPLFAWLSYSAALAALALHLTVMVVPQSDWGMYLLLLVPVGGLAIFARMRRRIPAGQSVSTESDSGAAPAVSKRGTSHALSSEWSMWSVRGLRLVIMIIGAVFWASFLSLWGQLPLALFAWLLFAFAVVLGFSQPWRANHWWADLWLMTWVAALLSMTVIWSRGQISPLGFVLVCLVALLWYLWFNAPMVRAITAFWGVFVLWAWPWIAPETGFHVSAAVFDGRSSALLIAVFLLTGGYRWWGQRQREKWLPLLLALWFWLLAISLGYCLLVFRWGMDEVPLPVFGSVTAFVVATTLWSILRPVFGAFSSALGALAALSLTFIWWPIPWLGLALTALLYSGYIGLRIGVYLFFLLFIALLGLWYEATSLTLLEKVGRLILGAGLLGALSVALDYRVRPGGKSVLLPVPRPADTAQKDSLRGQRPARLQLAALLVGVVAVYGSSGWFVYAQERILRHGISFDLELMPADPRALMQGDYMALRFGLSQSIRLLQYQHPQLDWPHMQLKVWVLPRKRSGARLYAVQLHSQSYLVQHVQRPLYAHYQLGGVWAQQRQDPHPVLNLVPIHDLSVLDNAIAITMQKKLGEWTPDGVNAWFFPEGQALNYSRARWGRFKADGRGAVVLETLLNARREPIDEPQ